MAQDPKSDLGAWELATDASEVHQLLLASDIASNVGSTPPTRNVQSTARSVDERSVHLLRLSGRPAAMITVTPRPPFDLSETEYAAVSPALYMQRLAVDPFLTATHPYLGVRAVRRALEVATASGAIALRAEANPRLERVLAILTAHGFRQVGQAQGPVETPRIYLERSFVSRTVQQKGP